MALLKRRRILSANSIPRLEERYMHAIQQLIESRISTNQFDSARPVSPAQIHELVRLATLAPSAYNFQNWKFIAVTSQAAKEALKDAAYGQQKVVDAAVTFIVCGKLDAHPQLEETLQPARDKGILSQAVIDSWVGMAKGSHTDNPGLQRDEAFRSASLAAMTLMLAAEGMGLATGPMSGFDPAAVSAKFGLARDEIPIILIATGYKAPGNWPQKPRKPVSDVLAIV
ncbi:nitroreductase family protein [Chromobacterium amazonense]|uniref:nitroreductase family protein n=1 Tax=Chromobacterium amazonense TaxID=1382803 RepID=UPI001B805299|nr:nitroreductase family protein [Chromobacterium amazonense]